MPFTIADGFREIAKFFRSSNGEPTNTNEETPVDEIHTMEDINPDSVKCVRCGNVMRTVNIALNDFNQLYIYTCPNCNMMAEYQLSPAHELIKTVHIYNASIAAGDGSAIETTELVPYNDFTLGRLWSVCGDLCYPAMVKADFPEDGKSSLVFVKVGTKIKENEIDGYIINDQNIIGRIMLTKGQVLSHFYNPYLARLPRAKFSYLSMPTVRCENLEAVIPVRFNHHKESYMDGSTMHKLCIIHDRPIRCIGFEVFVRFITHDIPEDEPMLNIINGIDLRSIIIGGDISAKEGYGIQSSHVSRHTLSAQVRNNINEKDRQALYDAIIDFFTLYDTNKGG